MSQPEPDIAPTPGDSPVFADTTPTPTSTSIEFTSAEYSWSYAALQEFMPSGRDAALTTPYAWPTPHCPVWTAISAVNPDYHKNVNIISAAYDTWDDDLGENRRGYHERFCLPSVADSWMSRYGVRNPNYAVGWFAGTGDADDSGAVCPQDWVALDMGVSSTYTSLNRPANWYTYSTAICCPRYVGWLLSSVMCFVRRGC